MRKLNFCLAVFVLGILNCTFAAAQSYPKNGLIFSKEFREGMDVSTVRRAHNDVPKGKTWVFFNEFKDADPPIRFAAGKDGKEGTSLYTRIKEKVGIKTTTRMPEKGTVIATFKVGAMKDRNEEGIEALWFAKVFMPGLVGNSEESTTDVFFVRPTHVKLTLNKDLHLVQEEKISRDSMNVRQMYYTYNADLGFKYDEWTTVAVTYDTDKETTTYYANGRKAEFKDQRSRVGDEPSNIRLGYTELGDVNISDIAIYNRVLSEKELLALTGGGSKEFTSVETPLAKPYVRMNWTLAWVQLGLAALFILINIFTGRFAFRPKLALIGGGLAILCVFLKELMPVIPVLSQAISTLAGKMPLNFPITLMDQFSYVAMYELPGVLVSLFLCFSVSFVDDFEDYSKGQKLLRMLLPFGILILVSVVGAFGAVALLVLLGVAIVAGLVVSLGSAKSDWYKNVRTGEIFSDMGTGFASNLIVLVGAMVVIILILFFLSRLWVFLFNFWFIYIFVKNFIKGTLDADDDD